MSNIKHPELKEEGWARINWVKEFMPVLAKVGDYFEKTKPFKGKTIAMCLHVEPKTAMLALTLKRGGANVVITGCNPLSTQDSAAAALADEMEVFTWRGQTEEEYNQNIMAVLDSKPDFIIDDGADMITMIHQDKPELLKKIIGGCEETTTGIVRLEAFHKDGLLKFPVLSINDADCKHLFDNRYGTGQSTIDGIMAATNLTIAGKNAVVGGYGWCARGIAARLDGMGANVTVTEVDAVRALEAKMDGFQVKTMSDAVVDADIVVTSTGCRDIVAEEHIKKLKDKCILANSGHFDIEIDKKALVKNSKSVKTVKPNVEEFALKNGKKVYLLGEGRLVNLVAGQGHPAEIMDMSFALQALGAEYLIKKGKRVPAEVIPMPKEIDVKVAELKLESMGVSIDNLSKNQQRYITSWDLE